jgi:hypothetical protein
MRPMKISAFRQEPIFLKARLDVLIDNKGDRSFVLDAPMC